MKITAEAILDLRQQLLDDVWAKAHQNWRDAKVYFDMERTFQVGATDVTKRVLGLARSKVLSMADTMVTDNPVVTRKANLAKDEKRSKDEQELWGQGALRDLCLPSGLQPPFKTAGTNLALYGYTAMALRWNDAEWGTFEKDSPELRNRRKNISPFELIVPHPARILLPPFDRQPPFAIETGTYSVFQLKRDYPQLEHKLHGKEFEMIEFIIYHSEEEFAVLINGELGFKRANMLGFVPYAVAYNSRGLESAPVYAGGSMVTALDAGANPADFAVGILDHCKSSITVLDEVFTGVAYQTKQTLYRQTYVAGPDAESVAEQKKNAKSGAIIVLPNTDRPIDQVIKMENPATVDPQAWQIINLARQDIGESTFGGEVQGFRSTGVDTATQHALMLGMSRQGFDVAVQQLNYLGAKVLEYMGRMIEARKETVWCDQIPMSGPKLDGDHRWIVNFNRDDEATLLRRGAAMREERKMIPKLSTYEMYQEAVGRGNASGIEDQVWLEEQMNSPDVAAFVRQAALAELARERGLPPPVMPGQPSPPISGPGQAMRRPPLTPFTPPTAPTGEQMLEGATVTPGVGMARAGM